MLVTIEFMCFRIISVIVLLILLISLIVIVTVLLVMLRFSVVISIVRRVFVGVDKGSATVVLLCVLFLSTSLLKLLLLVVNALLYLVRCYCRLLCVLHSDVMMCLIVSYV